MNFLGTLIEVRSRKCGRRAGCEGAPLSHADGVDNHGLG